ncbi:MAG: hypothetical protein HY690_08160 [Chloroflexi bacterium]|nr:hypothetical protein [Chloroflexota bacterium]
MAGAVKRGGWTRTLRWLLGAAVLAAAGLVLLVWLVPATPESGDGPFYLSAVEGERSIGGAAWHERRVLAPLIVRALPLSALDGFHALTLACIFATALLTWQTARALGEPEPRALAAIGLLFGTWAVIPNVREYALVDALAWAVVAALWLAAVCQRWWAAALLGVVGALARETVALAALAVAAASWHSHHQAQRLARALGVAAPAFGVVAALLVLVPGSGAPDPSTQVSSYLVHWWTNGLGSLGPARVAFMTFASYAALWLLLPRGYPRLPAHVQDAAGVLLVGATALLFVGTPERMLALAFPAMVSSALAATRDWSAWRRWALALGNAAFVARIGAEAVPAAVGWTGLALGLLVAASAYLPARGQSSGVGERGSGARRGVRSHSC